MLRTTRTTKPHRKKRLWKGVRLTANHSSFLSSMQAAKSMWTQLSSRICTVARPLPSKAFARSLKRVTTRAKIIATARSRSVHWLLQKFYKYASRICMASVPCAKIATTCPPVILDRDIHQAFMKQKKRVPFRISIASDLACFL